MTQLSPSRATESLPVTPSPYSPLSSTTNLPTTSSPPTVKVQVGIADPSLSQNDTLVNQLVQLINAVYTVAEEGIFNDVYRRTTPSDLKNLIQPSELALAWISSSSSDPNPPPSQYDSPTSKIIGCARVQSLSATHGVFGMLVCDPNHRGSGAGKKLVEFAEGYCKDVLGKTVMQCELLVSTEFEHPFKVRMHSWYERMGYKVVRIGDFGAEYPHLKPCLVTDVEFRVYEKPL
ncbi:hypothetical protein QBC37DRAFT_433991 [Rhypophila decipiens]|uniref:N-acetyltransferase domain-containing protein n=1 Tax=Rhypophila decipiens TaxID=261697 RepID=A0AAN7B3R0_9PEZI|nr:hypothetical protein QBC37DRAFT_433991 [Rhypophila decipiens]